LSGPVDGSDNLLIRPILGLQMQNDDAELFDLEISTDPNFSVIIETAELSKNEYIQNEELSENTQYYWR
jgi:hypothetical protein